MQGGDGRQRRDGRTRIHLTSPPVVPARFGNGHPRPTYGGNIARSSYEPAGFKLRLGLRDVSLALDAGAARGVSLPSAEIVRDALVMGVDQGLGDEDWSALADVAHRRAGIRR